jgi:hypothetical protein
MTWTPEMRQRQAELQRATWTPERRRRASERQRGTKDNGARPAVGFYVTKQGYRSLTGRWDHPLSSSKGELLEHRAVLYDKIGPGNHPCHWCGVDLKWDQIRADHHDGDRLNNAPENLLPACDTCNRRRSMLGNPPEWNPNLCAWGHEYTQENTYTDKRGHRSCRQCRREWRRRSRG